jgi:hypothetical protein
MNSVKVYVEIGAKKIFAGSHCASLILRPGRMARTDFFMPYHQIILKSYPLLRHQSSHPII